MISLTRLQEVTLTAQIIIVGLLEPVNLLYTTIVDRAIGAERNFKYVIPLPLIDAF